MLRRLPDSDAIARWLPVALAVPYLWFALADYHYELDDALIYMRYIRNLVDGFGLVYNPGEHFDGLTSPLFSYLTAALALVSRSARFATWLLSALPMYLAFVTLYQVFQRQLGFSAPAPRLTAAVGLVLAAALPYFFTTYGMETGLFLFLCALTLKVYLERRWAAFWIVGTLLALTRPEGVALVGACGLYFLCSARAFPPIRRRQVAIAAGLVAATVAANLFFFGLPWAETGAAKIWQGKSGYWGDHLIFWDVEYLQGLAFGDGFNAGALLVGAGIGIVVMGLSELNLVVLTFLVCYGAFFTAFNIPNYHWYYSVFFLFLPFWYATAGVYLAAVLVRGDAHLRARILAAALLCLCLYPVLEFVQVDTTVKDSRNARYARAGRWIGAHTPPSASLAAAEIGALGWYSKRPIVDILGLVSEGNARRIGERDFDGWMSDWHPDYLLVHDPPNSLEMGLYSFVARNAVEQRCDFDVEGYLLFRVEYRHEVSHFCKNGFELRRTAVGAAKVAKSLDAGHVDTVDVGGNFVRLTGWATGGTGKAFASLVVPDGRGVEFGLYERYARPDVVAVLHDPGYEQSGFKLLLRFRSPGAASGFARDVCLFTARTEGAAPLQDTHCGTDLEHGRDSESASAVGVHEDPVVADGNAHPPGWCPACPLLKNGFEVRPAPTPVRP